MKLIAKKFNDKDLNFNMTPEEVILKQFDYEFSSSVSVSDLYMPQDEQDKMEEWMKHNLALFKRMPTKMIDRQMTYLVLGLFPSILEEDK